MNGPNSFLLFPKSNELTNPGNTGKRSEFVGGNIYWSSATGAHPVAHGFLNKWGSYGYEAGFMKYPTTDEVPLATGPDGRRQEFQGTSMYYSIPTGTHNIQGLIRDKWKALGAEAGALGFPQSDEVTPLANTSARFNIFGTGRLYWTPTNGAHAIIGGIYRRWADAGYDTGQYGFPTSDATPVAGQPGTYTQNFQRGSITADSSIPADDDYKEVPGDPDTGQPFRRCGPDNDGEKVYTVDGEGTKRKFTCNHYQPLFGDDNWEWTEYALA